MNTPKTERQTSIENVLDSDFEFIDAWEVEDWQERGDDFEEKLIERIYEREIIYYQKAIEYLAENDASLQESLELAAEYGFELKNLSSETLATLLYQSKLNEQVNEIAEKLTECFEEEKAA